MEGDTLAHSLNAEGGHYADHPEMLATTEMAEDSRKAGHGSKLKAAGDAPRVCKGATHNFALDILFDEYGKYKLPSHLESSLVKQIGSGAYSIVASFLDSGIEQKTEAPVKFKLAAHYRFIKLIGSSSYGTVASALELTTGRKVAVRRITNAFDTFRYVVQGKLVLREVKLLQSIKHDNIISILDMYPSGYPDFDDIYIVTELMMTDLNRVIYSKQILSNFHHQYLSYQILRALLYLHSANVFHGDLRPSNMLVNRSCVLKICNFTLAHSLGNGEEEPYLQIRFDPVRTPQSIAYRAPEVIFSHEYECAQSDVWSVGCILWEMISQKRIFTGHEHLTQIKQIIKVIGSPSEINLAYLPARSAARRFLAKLPSAAKQPWNTICPAVTEDAADSIEGMLVFGPLQRSTVADCLALPYFETYRLPDSESIAETPVDWSFDSIAPTWTPPKRLLQSCIYKECEAFHPEKEQMA
eukprot:TRINITY_DN90800_c0_g1_i1.p1 TRINITY_DN90800_c0_g1~~TRINITY_DN90800_c0_g1_i1.p1  ORF type:complete len:491 (+),score=57.18 TRINITY_DN90800_c0_g1_i1:67-1473(+)